MYSLIYVEAKQKVDLTEVESWIVVSRELKGWKEDG
jgi:hypothetical protein